MTLHPEVEINTTHIVDVMRPNAFLSIFVVTAYRWGQRNAHSYVVGAFTDLEKAKVCAIAHVDYRGGKYACEVVEAQEWSEDADNGGKQVFYVESPYYGMAGDAGHFHPADQSKDARPCPKPFTVRELQNRIGELEREASAKAEFWRKHYADLDREKLLSLAIMRAVCREADMAKMDTMRTKIAEYERDIDAIMDECSKHITLSNELPWTEEVYCAFRSLEKRATESGRQP